MSSIGCICTLALVKLAKAHIHKEYPRKHQHTETLLEKSIPQAKIPRDPPTSLKPATP